MPNTQSDRLPTVQLMESHQRITNKPTIHPHTNFPWHPQLASTGSCSSAINRRELHNHNADAHEWPNLTQRETPACPPVSIHHMGATTGNTEDHHLPAPVVLPTLRSVLLCHLTARASYSSSSSSASLHTMKHRQRRTWTMKERRSCHHPSPPQHRRLHSRQVR